MNTPLTETENKQLQENRAALVGFFRKVGRLGVLSGISTETEAATLAEFQADSLLQKLEEMGFVKKFSEEA